MTNPLLVLSCALAVQLAETPPTDEELVAWIDAHAVPFAELGSPPGRALLDRLVEGKRIVLLGETDHFTQAKYDAWHALARELVGRGWRRVGMERGRSDGMRFDRYLETGREEDLDRVGLFGRYARDRENRDDVMHGAFVQEYAFARGLRALVAGDDRVRYFGYDIDFVPGGAYEDAAARLAPHGEDPAVAALLERLAALRERKGAEQRAGLSEILAALDRDDSALAAALPASVLVELREDVFVLRESLHFLLAPRQTVALMQRREAAMFRSIDHLLASWPADERVLLLGHNAHLSKDSRAFTMPTSAMWRSVGTHLAERLPGEVCSIWTLYDHGEHLAFQPRVHERVPSIAGTVEHVLARARAEAYLFPVEGLARAWLDRDRRFRHNALPTRGNLARQADAILFFRRTEAPHS